MDNIDDKSAFLGGRAGTLAGEPQTANRACLAACCYALQHTTGDLLIKPDASYLSNGYDKGHHISCQAEHADLWHCIGELSEGRASSLTIIRTAAHQRLNDVAKMTDLCKVHDFIGNLFADALAGKASTLNQIDLNVEKRVRGLAGKANLVLKRLLAVQMQFLESMGPRSSLNRPKRAKGDSTAFQVLLRDSQHAVMGAEGCRSSRDMPSRTACATCCTTATRRVLKQWLKADCRPMRAQPAAAATRLRPVGRQAVTVGRSDLHRSHQLLYDRGVWFCKRCGAYTSSFGARSSPRKLVASCTGRLTRAGRDCLRRLARGFPPKASVCWPAPEGLPFSCEEQRAEDSGVLLTPTTRQSGKGNSAAAAPGARLGAHARPRRLRPRRGGGRRGRLLRRGPGRLRR